MNFLIHGFLIHGFLVFCNPGIIEKGSIARNEYFDQKYPGQDSDRKTKGKKLLDVESRYQIEIS